MEHQNIVKFERFFEDKDNVYILLELCENKSLGDLMNARKMNTGKGLTEFECCYYLKQIVAALKYMHNQRVIHRDIKLGNCFLDSKMQIKIGDFGLAIELPELNHVTK